MEFDRPQFSNEVATFQSRRTVQRITNILTPGWINCKLRLRLCHKVAVPGRGGREVYEFGFVDGNSQMHGVSFQLQGKGLYAALEIGYDHIVHGIIQARPRNEIHAVQSNTHFDLMLFEVTVLEKYRSNDESLLAHPGGMLGLIGLLESGKTTGPFSFDMQNVSVVGGDLYRYLGCPHCQKSLPFPDSRGMYCCLTCPEGPGERRRQMFMYIKNLRIQDGNNNSVGEIMAYNDASESIIGQNAASFPVDSDAQEALEQVFGSKADLTIRFQKSTLIHTYSEMILVAIQVKLIPREENEDHEDTEDWGVDIGEVDGGSNQILEVDENAVPDTSICSWGKKKKKVHRVTVSISESYKHRKIVKPGETYPLNSDPPGYTLIINNYYFPKKTKNQRRGGAECDEKALCKLFPYLSMPIYREPFKDVESTELLEIIKEFQSFLIEQESDVCAVVILSHGSQNFIEMRDGKMVNIYDDILDHFSDEAFPYFAGKAKIFITEACQDYYPYPRLLQHANHTYSNMMVCLSQSPGDLSYRTPTGSVYIQELCKVFAEHARELNLRNLLRQLQENMKHLIITAPSRPGSPNSERRKYHQKPYHFDYCFSDFRFKVEDGDDPGSME